MKLKIKLVFIYFILCLMVLFCLIGCGKSSKYPSFKDSIITPSNGIYSDLGNYIILIDDVKNKPDYDKVVKYYNSLGHPVVGGCTACAKRNKEGDVLIGRNLDMEISLYPAFIIPTSFGKYKTMQIRYLSHDMYTYEEFKQEGYKNKDYINMLSYYCSDGLNEKGLYVEANVREANEGWQSTGTNPGKKRVRVETIVPEIVQNCATVQEAVEYMKNEIDIYSREWTDNETPTDYAWMMGDSTGEYGVVEIAFNKIVYIPYQPAQANFYLNPTWAGIDLWGSGYGRYEMILEDLNKVETQDEMLKHMEKAMWRDMALYQDCCYIDEDGVPHFVNDKGEKIEDWRSDYYFSMLYEIWSEEVVDEFTKDINQKWMIDDANVEIVFQYCKDFFVKTGGKEDLIEYYKGNELPLRTKVSAPTTGAQFSVNCTKKNMIVRFFENENLTYQFGF